MGQQFQPSQSQQFSSSQRQQQAQQQQQLQQYQQSQTSQQYPASQQYQQYQQYQQSQQYQQYQQPQQYPQQQQAQQAQQQQQQQFHRQQQQQAQQQQQSQEQQQSQQQQRGQQFLQHYAPVGMRGGIQTFPIHVMANMVPPSEQPFYTPAFNSMPMSGSGNPPASGMSQPGCEGFPAKPPDAVSSAPISASRGITFDKFVSDSGVAPGHLKRKQSQDIGADASTGPLEESANPPPYQVLQPPVSGPESAPLAPTEISGGNAGNIEVQPMSVIYNNPKVVTVGGFSPPMQEKCQQSPQDWLDDLLGSRGHSINKFCSLDSGYYSKPTEYQEASYGIKLVQLCRASDLKGARELMDCGLSFNPCNRFGESIIHMVCRRGNFELLQYFVMRGCCVQVCDDFGRTPLHDACWSSEPNFELVEFLLNIDLGLLRITDCRGATPLAYVKRENWDKWKNFFTSKKQRWWPEK